MILGDLCTRSCHFCSVSTARPEAPDGDEPQRVAEAALRLGLEHVVVTSVNRDDLPDEGATHFVRVIEELRKRLKDATIEVLTPDFKRTQSTAVEKILNAAPDIFNHNIETVPRLYKTVRPQAHYETSLQIFREIKSRSADTFTKSGLMLGLGERSQEVLDVLADLRRAGCDMLTLGQYLQSSPAGLPVADFVSPAQFLFYKNEALKMGFLWVESAPFVRSSFHAKGSFEELKKSIAKIGLN